MNSVRVAVDVGGTFTDVCIFDDETQRAEPAPIFTKRVVAPPSDRHRVETPAEAIAVSLDELGRALAALHGAENSAARRPSVTLASFSRGGST